MKNTQAILLPVLGGVLIIVFIALASAPLLLVRGRSGGGIWRGYTLLGVESGGPGRETAAEIAALEGMDALVCESMAQVSFNTFGGFARVPVADLERRLEARDPRMDPYMAGLSRYFRGERRGEPWSILYLKSRRRPAALKRQLAAVLEPQSLAWRLEGPTGTERLILLASFAGAALLVLAASSGRGRALALVSLAPWLPRVTAGGVLDLYSFLLLFPLWVPLAESAAARLRDRFVLGWREEAGRRLWTRALLLAAGFALAGLLFGYPASGEGTAAWMLGRAKLLEKNTVTMAASLLLLPLTGLFLSCRRSLRFHDVFQPLPIRQRSGKRPPRRLPAAGLLLIAAVCLPLFLRVTERNGLTAPRPAPTPLSGGASGFSWRGIAGLGLGNPLGQSATGQSATGQSATGQSATGQSADTLPDLAAYLAHRAFQEGLAFGRPYRLPTPGERLTVSYYLVLPDSREVVQTRRVVKRYQSAWLEQTLERAAPGDVEGLLVAQGEPLQVVSQAEHASLRQAFPPLKHLFLLLYMLAAAFLPDIYLTAQLLYGMRRILIRRNQHAV